MKNGMSQPRSTLSGADLRALRHAEQFTQEELAAVAGVSRQAIGYWERRDIVEREGYALELILLALGFDSLAHACWWLDERHEALAKSAGGDDQRRSCGAKTGQGQPCSRLPEPGRKRCRYHGGCSTGPRTSKGRSRISEAQYHRWEAWRRDQANR